MTRRMFHYAALVVLFLGVCAQESLASVTFRIENTSISPGATSGAFDILIDVDDVGTTDTGILFSDINVAIELGSGGTVGGGGGATTINFSDGETPTVNPLFPGVDPTTAPDANPAEIKIAYQVGAAAAQLGTGGKHIVTIPYTLSNPAIGGESSPIAFTVLVGGFPVPFQSFVGSGEFRHNLSDPPVFLTNGAITVAAVPEPGSMLALGALFTAGGIRHFRKKRKAA